MEGLFSRHLHKQEPQQRFKQICCEDEEEIYWEELPIRNGRMDDVPFCPICGPIQEWMVLDKFKDEIIFYAALDEVEDED